MDILLGEVIYASSVSDTGDISLALLSSCALFSCAGTISSCNSTLSCSGSGGGVIGGGGGGGSKSSCWNESTMGVCLSVGGSGGVLGLAGLTVSGGGVKGEALPIIKR